MGVGRVKAMPQYVKHLFGGANGHYKILDVLDYRGGNWDILSLIVKPMNGIMVAIDLNKERECLSVIPPKLEVLFWICAGKIEQSGVRPFTVIIKKVGNTHPANTVTLNSDVVLDALWRLHIEPH